jgi:hypothetical protein
MILSNVQQAAIFDTNGASIGRVVVQVDATFQTVRQLLGMFVLKDKNVPAYLFFDKNREAVPRVREREVLACDSLHAPQAGNTLPVILISYGGESDARAASVPSSAAASGARPRTSSVDGGREADLAEDDGTASADATPSSASPAP